MGVPEQMFVTIPDLRCGGIEFVWLLGTAINSGGHSSALL
jgi:hypothetical protein